MGLLYIMLAVLLLMQHTESKLIAILACMAAACGFLAGIGMAITDLFNP